MQELHQQNNYQTCKLGQLVMTRGVSELVSKDEQYRKAVGGCLERYTRQDWGDICDEDKKTNRASLKSQDRIVARYDIRPEPIYIITEWDRSVTTILFPREY